MTVEEALAELQEIFPRAWCYIDQHSEAEISPKGKRYVATRTEIQIEKGRTGIIYKTTAATLDEAMAQVRAAENKSQ